MHDHDRCACAVLFLALTTLAACSTPHPVTVRHDDGSSSTGAHAGGLRDGPWVENYPDGKKQSEGSYEHDVQTGLWTYWFENGRKEMEGRFENERREGQWSSWYENGALRAQGRFESGFEEGPWRFYSSTGELDHEGLFELGQPVLRWNYFHRDGTVRETGAYLAGVKVGDWTARDDAGRETVLAYPLPSGCEWVEERFADSTPKRAGFLRDGTPAGPWITRHPGGKLRLECTFSGGEPNGRAHAWREDGSLFAEGTLKNGCIAGEWIFTPGAAREPIDFEPARPRQTFSGDWSPAKSADLSGPTVVEAWVAEICSPRQPAPTRSATAPSIRPPETALAAGDAAGIPARAQPWTEYESSALPALVNLYGKGKSGGGDSDWNAPVLRRPRPKSGGSAAPPDLDGLIGHALPVERFTAADGGTINLEEFAGKKNVLVTILRGFGGQVCVYCTAQTKALADYAREFAALDTEVVVVFPGPASGLDAFLEAYRRTFGPGEKLPYVLLYDTDLALTRALHIEDNIAVPTSIVLDKKGIVRWCHVAKDYADRPPAKKLLDVIADLPKDGR